MSDTWDMIVLGKRHAVYGDLPGQSVFYTNEQSVLLSNFEREPLFQSLQVRPNVNFGYRPFVGRYVVTKDMRFPFGIVKANPQLGEGLANQYFITSFKQNLDLVKTIELRSIYDNGLQPNRPGY